MSSVTQLVHQLQSGECDPALSRACACGLDGLPSARQRALSVVDGFCKRFSPSSQRSACLFSAPGRTELGGNHTDHQQGCVLAASVNLDILACASENGTSLVRIQSEGYPLLTVDLSCLTPVAEETNTSAALIRGIAARISQLGFTPRGFDAYAVSNVLQGSGLSSSAAYEVLIGVIFNHFFCGGSLTPVQIAQVGQYAENVFFGKPCGLMDQMACSVGGITSIDFADPLCPAVSRVDFDFSRCGYALCIVDSGADHADLTSEYAAIPAEMKAVASHWNTDVLRHVSEEEFFRELPRLRSSCGDRAVLRAIHFFAENRRAAQEADALSRGDFAEFLRLCRASGASSFMYLQNVYCSSHPAQQAVSVALAVADRLLSDQGALRVHGGGFAGTIQAFVPQASLSSFCSEMEAMLGKGCCHPLHIRSAGGIVLVP